MPIEIVELTIKATITENERDPASDSSAPRDQNLSEESGEKDLIIQEAVDKVLEILRREYER